MFDQLLVITWAQWRTARNHLPHTTFGSLLAISLAIVWYGGFATVAVFLAISLPGVPFAGIQRWLSAGLLAVFLLWQLLPLATAAGGWSLDLKRLQTYPIPTSTLLTLDAVLRISAGFEMLLLLCGSCAGLLFHDGIPFYGPVLLLALFIPFNLLLALAIRDFITRGFQKSRLREILTVLFLSVTILPNLVVRLGWFPRIKQYVLAVANASFAPWHNLAGAAVGPHQWRELALSLVWVGLAYIAASRQFGASLREEETLRSARPRQQSRMRIGALLAYPAEWFSDPIGAIAGKEIRTLLRMPRFRVVFALSILLSCLVLPLAFQSRHATGFLAEHSGSLMGLYAVVVLADALMWNVFGFDRNAAQIYFAAPVDFRSVLYAKNIVASLFLLIQAVSVTLLAGVFRRVFSASALGIQLLSLVVVTTFFLAVGNVCSVLIPRAVDPRATMRKQAGGAIQLWILGSMAAATILLGLAYLAEWAADSKWAALGVLGVEWIIGMIYYRVATDYAVEQGSRRREELVTALSKRASVAGP